ncbi:MAG: SCP2 sterol-binding domain-containing protein [Bdellovibrionota bacterium]
MAITSSMSPDQVRAELGKISPNDNNALREIAKDASPKQVYEVIMPFMFEKRGEEVKAVLAQVNGSVLWDITGDGGGKWAMVFDGSGAFKVHAGDKPDASATIQLSYENWKLMQSGAMPPQQLFMSGQMMVTGDMSIIMQLQGALPQ